MHQPLSKELAAIIAEHGASGSVSLNHLLVRTQGRALYLVIMILCLPFVVPVSIPGLSTVLGTIIALLALRLALGQEPRLPRFLGERKLPVARILKASIRFLRLIERVIRPRRTRWLTWRSARFFNSMVIIFLAFLLALPLPAPPFFFTNSLPSYAIILLAASMMEEDGVLIWAAYALVLANIIFFGLIAGAIIKLLMKMFAGLMRSLS
jgi:hypothetical protein